MPIDHRVLLLVGLILLASGVTFAATVRHPVFDEPNYDADVTRYERQGITLSTLRAQESASTPMLTVLAGIAGRLSPGDIRARRLAVLGAWALAIGLAVWLASRSRDEALSAALLGLICFPHVPTSMGSLLTEGPTAVWVLAILSATWAGCQNEGPRLSAAFATGIACGFALLTRQFAIAAAGAAAMAWLISTRSLRLTALASLGTLGAMALLLAVWGGLSSPGSRGPTGPAMHSTVALNLGRPLAALVYLGLYVAPLVPWTRLLHHHWRATSGLLAGAVAVELSGTRIWGDGPINTVLGVVARRGLAVGAMLSIALIAVALAAVAFVGQRLWTLRYDEATFRDPVLVFAALVTVLFVVEQAGVGGTIPYFERYTFFAFPWATYVTLRVFADRTRAMVLLCASMAIAGQVMLWRHA